MVVFLLSAWISRKRLRESASGPYIGRPSSQSLAEAQSWKKSLPEFKLPGSEVIKRGPCNATTKRNNKNQSTGRNLPDAPSDQTMGKTGFYHRFDLTSLLYPTIVILSITVLRLRFIQTLRANNIIASTNSDNLFDFPLFANIK